MWKYVLNKMIKQKEAAFFIVMIILSFAVSSAAPYLNGKFIDLLTVSKDIHLIVQFALIIVGVGVVGALLSYCSNLTTVKVLTKTTMASIYEGMDNLLETDLVIAEKLDFSYITQRLFQDANVVQYLTARMQSVSDMENITTLISDINMDGCLNLDLMENDLNDLNLIKGVILEEWM